MLVLQRSRRMSNAGLWGLPGGRRDRGEGKLDAALREGVEELGELPPGRLLGTIRVARPRAGPYEIMVCRTTKRTRATWKPRLNEEHVRWRWVSLAWLRKHDKKLHPVLRAIMRRGRAVKALRRAIDKKQIVERPKRPKRRKGIKGARVERLAPPKEGAPIYVGIRSG